MAIPALARGPRPPGRSPIDGDDAAALPADERLVERCRAGSEEAFAAIVDRYGPALRRHCARIVDRAAAEDAVQEAFVAAWVALRDGAEVRALRPWLFTIARRKALTAHSRAPYAVELTDSLPGARSCAEEAARATRAREALAALAALPVAQRDALIGSALHGRSGTQLARQLGVPEATVRQLVFRARERLRAAGAAVLAPPLALARLLRRASAVAARTTTAAPGPIAAGTAAKVGVVVVVAASVGGAAAGGAFDAAQHHHDARVSAVRAVSLPHPSVHAGVGLHARTPARRAASAVRVGHGAARRERPAGTSSVGRHRTRGTDGRGASVAPAPASAAGSAPPPTAVRSTTPVSGQPSTADTVVPRGNTGASSDAATLEPTGSPAGRAATDAVAPVTAAGSGTTKRATGTVAQTAGQVVAGTGQVVAGTGQAVTGAGTAVTGAGQAVTGAGQAIQGAGQAVGGGGAGPIAQGAGQAVQGAGPIAQGAGQAVQGVGQTVQGVGQAVQGAGQTVQGVGQAVQGTVQQVGSGAASILHGVGATGATGPLGIG